MSQLAAYILVLSAVLFTNTSYAELGSLLNQVKKKGSELGLKSIAGPTPRVSNPALSSDTIMNNLHNA